jgi:hypothetical protein
MENPMSHADTFAPYDPATVPSVIADYLTAHGDGSDPEVILETFTADARVTDEGIDYEGRHGIRGWLTKTGSEYTYTTTLTGQRQDASDRWTVIAHLEGDFPGGTVDLAYRFTLREDKISTLIIAP